MPNKNRTLIKLDDEVVEITQGKKGLEAKKITDQDLLEISLLDEGVEKLIENDIHKLANEAYTELQADFKETLKKNVLKVVGFENRWHQSGWEVDHCNGRASHLTEYMSTKVKSMFTEEFDKMLQPEIEAMLKPIRKVLVQEFKNSFTHSAKEHIRKAADDAASNFVRDVMVKQIKKHQRKALEQAEIAFLGRKARRAEDDESED